MLVEEVFVEVESLLFSDDESLVDDESLINDVVVDEAIKLSSLSDEEETSLLQEIKKQIENKGIKKFSFS